MDIVQSLPSPTDLVGTVNQLAADLASLQKQVQMTAPQSSMPPCSKKQAYSYTAELALAQGSVARTPGTFTVSQDGPFVALAVQAAWRETSGQFAGRWLPPSSEELYIRQMAQFNFANPPRPDTVDFVWEVQD